MTNTLELFKDVLVTIVTHDGTIVAGRVSHDDAELVLAQGPSEGRAGDMIAAVGEALGHDALFGLLDDLMDDIVAAVPWEGEGTMEHDRIAAAVGLREAQYPALRPVLDRLVRQGRIVRTPDDTYYEPED